MPTLRVQPRPTPEERADVPPEVEVDEELADFAAALEDWVATRDMWELRLRQGHDFGRRNNVEAELVFAAGEQTSTVSWSWTMLPKNSIECAARIARPVPVGTSPTMLPAGAKFGVLLRNTWLLNVA